MQAIHCSGAAAPARAPLRKPPAGRPAVMLAPVARSPPAPLAAREHRSRWGRRRSRSRSAGEPPARQLRQMKQRSQRGLRGLLGDRSGDDGASTSSRLRRADGWRGGDHGHDPALRRQHSRDGARWTRQEHEAERPPAREPARHGVPRIDTATAAPVVSASIARIVGLAEGVVGHDGRR